MKKFLIPSLIGIAAIAFLSGCDIRLGGGSTTKVFPATVGEQLVDLKRAKECGAISDSEYEAEKTKILAQRQ